MGNITMKKILLASAAALAMGASAASAATLEFELYDHFAFWDNGFTVFNNTEASLEAYQPTYSMNNGYNYYSYELDPGDYTFTLWDNFYGYIHYAALYLDGEVLGSCYHCNLGDGSWYQSVSVDFEVSEVPLPASALLLLGGLAGLGVMRKKKKA